MKSDTRTILAQLETLQRRIAKNKDLKEQLPPEERERIQNIAHGLTSTFRILDYTNN